MFTNLAIERGPHIVGNVPSLHSPEVKDGVPDFPQKTYMSFGNINTIAMFDDIGG